MSEKLVAQAIGAPDLLTTDEISTLGAYAMQLQAEASRGHIERSKVRINAIGVVLCLALLMIGMVKGCESCNSSKFSAHDIAYEATCDAYSGGDESGAVIRNMCRDHDNASRERTYRETSKHE